MTDAGILASIFPHCSETPPEGPKKRCPVMRGSSNKAELTEQDVCSLTHTVKTVEIKSKQENIKKLKQCECSEASWNSSKKTTGRYIL